VGSLVRAYNIREGIRRRDDTVPKRLFNRAPYLQYRKLEPDLLDKWLDRWYQLKGWNSDGVPTRETLAGLGLSDIGRELEQRGILTS
jgi:aldehyde:ferredoxin oxidoreductase